MGSTSGKDLDGDEDDGVISPNRGFGERKMARVEST